MVHPCSGNTTNAVLFSVSLLFSSQVKHFAVLFSVSLPFPSQPKHFLAILREAVSIIPSASAEQQLYLQGTLRIWANRASASAAGRCQRCEGCRGSRLAAVGQCLPVLSSWRPPSRSLPRPYYSRITVACAKPCNRRQDEDGSIFRFGKRKN